VVGEHPGAVRLLDAEGHELKLAQHGWDHLRQA
jgi:hypothetical protein